MAVVRILRRDGSFIREVQLPGSGEPIGIGRDRANVIRLDDDRVSRAHAEIELRGDGCVLRDLGSTNGTWIRGERVDERPLTDGDRVLLGHHVLEYRAHDRARAGATAQFDADAQLEWPTHCHACGASLNEGVRFCTSCGATSEPESTRQRCPHCAQVASVGARFCGVCGGALGGQVEVPGAQLEEPPAVPSMDPGIEPPVSDLTVGEAPPAPRPEFTPPPAAPPPSPLPPPRPEPAPPPRQPADVGAIELTGSDAAISGSFEIGSPKAAVRPAAAPPPPVARTSRGRPHSPGVALLSGVLVPGGAQAYNGQLGAAILVLLSAVLVVPWIVGVVLGVRRAREIVAQGGRRGRGGGWWVAIQVWLLVDLLLAVAVVLTLLGYLPWGG